MLALTAQPLGMHTMLHYMLDVPREHDLDALLVCAPLNAPAPRVVQDTEHRIEVPDRHKQFWAWTRHACADLSAADARMAARCPISLPSRTRACSEECAAADCVICAQPSAWRVHCQKCHGAMCLLCAQNVESCPFCRDELRLELCAHARPHPDFVSCNDRTALPRNFCARFFQFLAFVRDTKLRKVIDLAASAHVLAVSNRWAALLRLHRLATADGAGVRFYPSKYCSSIMLMHMADVRSGAYCNFNSSVQVVFMEKPTVDDMPSCYKLAAGRELHTITYDIE